MTSLEHAEGAHHSGTGML